MLPRTACVMCVALLAACAGSSNTTVTPPDGDGGPVLGQNGSDAGADGGGVDGGAADGGTADGGTGGGSSDGGPVTDGGTGGGGSDGGTASGPAPLPRISKGRPAFASEGNAALLTDGAYRAPNAWSFTPSRCSASTPCWAAVRLGAGPSRILVEWSFQDGEGDFDTRTWGGSTVKSYALLVSNDSTNGADGTWAQAVDDRGTPLVVNDNTYIQRTHLVRFSGASWIKLAITSTTAPSIDELDVWDASAGTDDTWFFHGDSITHRCANLRGTAPGYSEQPSFQQAVANAVPGRFPDQIGGGIVSHGVPNAVQQITAYLQAFPMVKNWVLTMGTNDLCRGAAVYKSGAQGWIDAVKAAGRVPILVHPIWANNVSAYCPGNGPALNSAIDDLVRTNGLRAPVPLYEATAGHPEFFDPGDVHPSPSGCAAWNRTMATSLAGARAVTRPR